MTTRAWSGTSADWTTPGNWTPSGVPGTADVARFLSTAGSLTVTGSPPVTAGTTNVGEIWDDGANLTLTGTFNTTSLPDDGIPVDTEVFCGLKVDNGGSLAIGPGAGIAVFTGGAMSPEEAGAVYIGDTSDGSLTLLGSLFDSFVTIGLSADGAAVVSGTGADWTTFIGIDVGEFGAAGSLLIEDGGAVTSFDVTIGGENDAATVVVTGAGSTLTATDSLEVHGNGATLALLDGAAASSASGGFTVSGQAVLALDASAGLAGFIGVFGGTLMAVPEAGQVATTVVDLANPVELLNGATNTVMSEVGTVLRLEGSISDFFDATALTLGGGTVELTDNANSYSGGSTLDAGTLERAPIGWNRGLSRRG